MDRQQQLATALAAVEELTMQRGIGAVVAIGHYCEGSFLLEIQGLNHEIDPTVWAEKAMRLMRTVRSEKSTNGFWVRAITESPWHSAAIETLLRQKLGGALISP